MVAVCLRCVGKEPGWPGYRAYPNVGMKRGNFEREFKSYKMLGYTPEREFYVGLII